MGKNAEDGYWATSCPPTISGRSEDVEIRWAIHQRGERRAEWVAEERRTAVIILINGRFKVKLPGQNVVLAQQGDYILFHGISHSWEAETDCTVLGVRWPSIPGYQSPRDCQK